MWQPLIEQFGGEWSLLVPDLPGHDRSAGHDYVSHEQAVRLLAGLLEQRSSGPVTVVGFSLGAQLAVLLASQHPELVERVAVISAQARPMRWPAATLGMLTIAAPLAKNGRFARAQARELFIPPPLMPAYLRTSASLSKQTLLASVGENIRFTVPEGWSSFPGESLILVGAGERQLMKASAEVLAQAHPRSAAEVVDGCGHGIPLQRPEWLAERLRQWLR